MLSIWRMNQMRHTLTHMQKAATWTLELRKKYNKLLSTKRIVSNLNVIPFLIHFPDKIIFFSENNF